MAEHYGLRNSEENMYSLYKIRYKEFLSKIFLSLTKRWKSDANI